MRLTFLFLFIPFFASGLTFKNGESGKSYETINWGDTEVHGRDINKKWSQDVENEFSRINGFSHRFELRAKECAGDDCSRGSYKGSWGRTEAYLNNPLDNQHAGEIGENWYAWSFLIDNSELTYSSISHKEVDNHLIQFGHLSHH